MSFIEDKIDEFRKDYKKVLLADAEKIRDAINSGEWWDIKDTVDTWSNIREVPSSPSPNSGLFHKNVDYNYWLSEYFQKGIIPAKDTLPADFAFTLAYSENLNRTSPARSASAKLEFWNSFFGINIRRISDNIETEEANGLEWEEVLFSEYLQSTRFKNELEEQTLISEVIHESWKHVGEGTGRPTNQKLFDAAMAASSEAIEGDLSDATREFLEAGGITEGIRKRAKVGQQMLLSNLINPFAEANRERQSLIPVEPARGNDQLYMLLGNPLFLLNKLTYNGGADSFIDAKTEQISSLVPMMRFYKTYYDKDGKTRQVELEFDNKFNSSLLNSGQHGQVGIKSFDWNLNATNPDTVRNDIEARLVIYFQSFDDLSRDRGFGRNKYSYQDLVIRPLVKSKKEDENIEKKASSDGPGNKAVDSSFYEIKAVVGWAPPKVAEFWSNTDAPSQQQLAMFLTLVDHEFSFTQEGTFELAITYRARLEDLVENPQFDVLSNPAGKAVLDELKRQISKLKSECGADNSESIKTLQNSLREQKKIFRDNFSKAIMNTMMNSSNVHTLKDYSIGDLARLKEGRSIDKVITEGDVRDSLIDSDRHKYPAGRKLYGFAGDEESPAAPKSKGTEVLSDEYPIVWFYFGDLVKAAIEHTLSINEHSNTNEESRAANKLKGLISKNLSMLLGSVAIREVTDGREVDLNVNLADLPISVSFFNKWFIRHIVESKRGSFPLIEFMRNIVSNLCVASLRQGQKIGSKKANKYLVKSTTFSLPSLSPEASKRGVSALGPHPLSQYSKVPVIGQGATTTTRITTEESYFTIDEPETYQSLSYEAEIERVINTDNIKCSLDNGVMDRTRAQSMDVENSYHCMMFYIITDNGYGSMRGPGSDVEESAMSWIERDRRNGVHHLYIGADRGLLKEISFSKNNQPFLREARLQQDELNPLAQLAATYNANLNLVGNTIFWPGQYVYINPLGFGTGIGHPYKKGTPANQLGLGGYHLITEVKSFIESGKFETSIKALFTTSGDGGSIFGESKTFKCGDGTDNSNAKTSKN